MLFDLSWTDLVLCEYILTDITLKSFTVLNFKKCAIFDLCLSFLLF